MVITLATIQSAPWDFAALALLVATWIGIGFWIEYPWGGRPSVSVLMARYRYAWMRELVHREQRIFDAALLQNLRDGSAFFASTCLIALGGVLTLVGNPGPLEDIASQVPTAQGSPFGVQVKLIPAIVLLTSAFLRFVWANRLFGYFSVLIGSVPVERGHPDEHHRATQAAVLNIRAAANFNRGLRAVYFSLASLAWLVGAVPLILAALAAAWTLYEREFLSKPRAVLADRAPPMPGEPKPKTDTVP